MDKKELLFYDAYEEFYEMARRSEAFRLFCRDAYGEDFSQDGFSDIRQIDRILKYIPKNKDIHVLDIGCGNGKMLGYLQKKTGVYICGFDYSEEAIRTAKALFPERSEFRRGVIGEIVYPEEVFDLVVSMDTMYFARDMSAFVGQIKRWMKKDAVFFVGYQEGDVVGRTENVSTTLLANALDENGLKYETEDITRETFELLRKKRVCALKHRTGFESEGYGRWFELRMMQTECAECPYEEFEKKMARYIYIVKKG